MRGQIPEGYYYPVTTHHIKDVWERLPEHSKEGFRETQFGEVLNLIAEREPFLFKVDSKTGDPLVQGTVNFILDIEAERPDLAPGLSEVLINIWEAIKNPQWTVDLITQVYNPRPHTKPSGSAPPRPQ